MIINFDKIEEKSIEGFKGGKRRLQTHPTLPLLQHAEGNAQSVTVPASQTAAKMASKTRERSSMPAFATGMTNDEFWAEYKNERRVELAFEGHRFYDVRRWMA